MTGRKGEKHMEKALATADYRVHGTITEGFFKGKEFDKKVHFELHKSGAFEYGNQTCMIMQFEGSEPQMFDTRYEKVSAKSFGEYTQEFIYTQIAEGLKAEPIEA